MDRIPIKETPRLFDRSVAMLQREIGRRLSWLNHVFGLCEVLTTEKDGRRFRSANIYTGKGRYQQIAPCSELGNFCFFMLKDPHQFSESSRNEIVTPFYAVFWYKVDDVSSSPDERNREAIKEQILSVLRNIRYPIKSWGRIYENPENIFSDFSYDFVDNQFLMSPYAGIKVEGELRGEVGCVEKVLKGDYNIDYNDDYLVRRKGRKKDDSDYNLDYDEDYKS